MDILYFGGNEVYEILGMKQEDCFLYGGEAEKRQ